MRRAFTFLILLAAALVLVGVRPAGAQTVPAPHPARTHLGFRASLIVDHESLAASKSFKAVLGTSSLTEVGFGADATGLWKGLFARVSFTTATHSGSRVVVNSAGKSYSLGIPLTLKLTPIEVGGGWRFGSLGGRARIVPYVGAALLLQRYREQSKFADASENTSTTDRGDTLFAGVELGVAPIVKVAVEGLYRNLPNAVGRSGVFQAYTESNLGGGVIRFSVGVGF